MELVPNSTLSTKQIRSHFKIGRRDAVAIKDRSVNDAGVAEGVITYKSGEAYKQRAERRAKQGNGLTAKPRLCGWTRQANGAPAPSSHERTEPLHMNTSEPASAGKPVALKASPKKPAAEALASKSKFPKRAKSA